MVSVAAHAVGGAALGGEVAGLVGIVGVGAAVGAVVGVVSAADSVKEVGDTVACRRSFGVHARLLTGGSPKIEARTARSSWPRCARALPAPRAQGSFKVVRPPGLLCGQLWVGGQAKGVKVQAGGQGAEHVRASQG